MGLSAFSKCLVLLEIVESVGTHSDACDVVANKLTSDWSSDTIKRYIAVAKKLKSMSNLMNEIMQLEYEQGRDSALDGITALRSLTSLNLEDKDAVFIATLFAYVCM